MVILGLLIVLIGGITATHFIRRANERGSAIAAALVLVAVLMVVAEAIADSYAAGLQP